MAGKHRKSSRPSAVVARVMAPGGLAAAAVTATSLSTAVMTGTTTAAAPSVELVALVSAANSTSQFFAGSTYYGTDWTTVYGDQQVVPFLLGPQGLATAISAHQDDEDEPTGVTASGWGAGQTGTALGILANNDDPDDLDNVGLVILDNNTNRAGGGFWTTYHPFAPLLLTSAEPTPTDLPDGVTVLDVGYEYNINGNAPVDPLNLFSLGNSLAAYAFGYGAEATALDITQEENGAVVLHQANGQDLILEPGTHYVVEDGNVVRQHSADGTAENPNNSTIYVTVDSGDLPLTRGLRLIPGGDILADALDPTLTELVNAGYNDGLGEEGNEAIPVDPTVPRPMQPGSSLGALDDAPGSVQTGFQKGIDKAGDDISNRGSFVIKPLDEAGKLPLVSSLPSLTTNSSTTRLTTDSPNKFLPLPRLNKPGTTSASGSSGNARPGQKFADRISEAVNKVTGGLQGDKTDDSSE